MYLLAPKVRPGRDVHCGIVLDGHLRRPAMRGELGKNAVSRKKMPKNGE